MDTVAFNAIIQPYDEKGSILLHIEERWYPLVKECAKSQKWTTGSKLRVTFEPWSDDCSEEAFRLFHKLRDCLAFETGGRDKAWADQLKQELKAKYGISKIFTLGGGMKALWLKSTKEYTVREMFKLIEGTIDECELWQVDIHQYLPEYKEMEVRINEDNRIDSEL